MQPLLLFPVFLFAMAGFAHPAAAGGGAPESLLIEDFQSYEAGTVPSRWEYFSRRDKSFIDPDDLMSEDRRFFVVQEGGNRFIRGFTHGEAQRISLGNERAGFQWQLKQHPRLGWRWRANELPAGAREDDVNDTGGAVYVTFPRKDWLGRPHSIKYTYSSTLPIGRSVDSGPVKIIVASTGADGYGDWVTVKRNVVEDYRRLFGDDPPDEPFSITLWSDSDNTGAKAEVDFDDIRLLP